MSVTVQEQVTQVVVEESGDVTVQPGGDVTVVVEESPFVVETLAGEQGPAGPAGPKGDTGTQGPPGPANVLSIGTVEASEPDGDASASITGAAPEQTLNLVLPRGERGPEGPPGQPSGAVYDEKLDEVTTTSSSLVDLGGPSVTLNIQEGGQWVNLLIEFEAKTATGGGLARATAVDAASPSDALIPVSGPSGTAYSEVHRPVAFGGIDGVAIAFLSEGEHTLEMRYQADAGAGTCSYRNRKLWAWPAGAGEKGDTGETGPAGADGTDGAAGADGADGAIATIRDDGSDMTQRGALNFVGATVTDDAVNEQTTVTIEAGGGGGLTGEMKMWPSSVLPLGYLWADGSEVSRATYAALFAAIGTEHGAGDGSTTFNLPDMRGRVAVGPDAMGGTPAGRLTENNELGDSGGEEKHTLTDDEMPSHSHTVAVMNAQASTPNLNWPAAGSVHGYWDAPTSSVGGDDPHNNMQPFLILNYIIKT